MSATHTQERWELIGAQGTAIWCGDEIIAQMSGPRQNHKLARRRAELMVDAPAMRLALDLIAAGVAEIRDGMFICDGLHIRPDEFGGWNFVMERIGWNRAVAALETAREQERGGE